MSLKQLLAELQTEYLASFSGKAERIGQLWREKRLRDLQTEYHKLKGTGRTYGLPEVTQLGEVMEELCEAAPSSLESAVPLSLILLQRIATRRASAEAVALDEDAEFKALVDLAMAPR